MARRLRGLRSARSGTAGLSLASLVLVLVGTGRAGLLFRLVWLLVRHTLFLLVGGEGLVLGVAVEILKAEMHFAIKVKFLLDAGFISFFYALFFSSCGIWVFLFAVPEFWVFFLSFFSRLVLSSMRYKMYGI